MWPGSFALLARGRSWAWLLYTPMLVLRCPTHREEFPILSNLLEFKLLRHVRKCLSPKLSLSLVSLKFSLRDNIQKNFIWGVTEGEHSIFHICFELTRDCRPYLSGILTPSISVPEDLYRWCLLFECLSSRIKIAHGNLFHLQRLTALSHHVLDSKSLYSGKDKYDWKV
jgi:hypothetical protein